MTFIANSMITVQDKSAFVSQFQKLDINGDGKISKEELTIAYMKLYENRYS